MMMMEACSGQNFSRVNTGTMSTGLIRSEKIKMITGQKSRSFVTPHETKQAVLSPRFNSLKQVFKFLVY